MPQEHVLKEEGEADEVPDLEDIGERRSHRTTTQFNEQERNELGLFLTPAVAAGAI